MDTSSDNNIALRLGALSRQMDKKRKYLRYLEAQRAGAEKDLRDWQAEFDLIREEHPKVKWQ